ncbi:lipase chaperone [Aeromonas sobria]|nr:lipase chaperone [Aeromonas sobria]
MSSAKRYRKWVLGCVLGMGSVGAWWFYQDSMPVHGEPIIVNHATPLAAPMHTSERYKQFRDEERALQKPTDAASLGRWLAQREALRQRYFSPAEQTALFERERRREKWVLMNQAIQLADAETRAGLEQEREDWLAEQSIAFQTAVRNSRLNGELQQMARLTEGEEEAQWLEHYGPEASDRLRALREARRDFEQRWSTFLAQWEALPSEQRALQLPDLMLLQFPSNEWKRVEVRLRQSSPPAP